MIVVALVLDTDDVDDEDDDDDNNTSNALLDTFEMVDVLVPPLVTSRPGVRLFSRDAPRASRCNSCAAAVDCFFLKYLLIVLVVEAASLLVSLRLWPLDLVVLVAAAAVLVKVFASGIAAATTAT